MALTRVSDAVFQFNLEQQAFSLQYSPQLPQSLFERGNESPVEMGHYCIHP